MIKLSAISHCALQVIDIERSKRFYTEVLGFQITEEDPEHGGVFMALGDSSHTLDLAPRPGATDADLRPAPPGPAVAVGPVGLHHIAFSVDSEEALREGYFELLRRQIPVLSTMDHGTSGTVYFFDPDNNMLELNWERPGARAVFLAGRADGNDIEIDFSA